MALHRAFSGGCFRCSGVSPTISVADFPKEGYALVIRKDLAKDFCLGCIKDFVAKREALRMVENEKYLTIHST
jgi:hypothetical protein